MYPLSSYSYHRGLPSVVPLVPLINPTRGQQLWPQAVTSPTLNSWGEIPVPLSLSWTSLLRRAPGAILSVIAPCWLVCYQNPQPSSIYLWHCTHQLSSKFILGISHPIIAGISAYLLVLIFLYYFCSCHIYFQFIVFPINSYVTIIHFLCPCLSFTNKHLFTNIFHMNDRAFFYHLQSLKPSWPLIY